MGSHGDDGFDSPTMAIGGKIMMASIVAFAAVIFFLVFRIYARCFSRRRDSLRSRRLAFVGEQDAPRLRSVGLGKSAIEALAVFVFQLENYKDGLECAVCLREFEGDEKGRLLPKCNHSFHIDCIDMWFQSHSTCPLCRESADPDTPADSVVVVVEQAALGSSSETEHQVSPVSEGNASISREPDPNLCDPCRHDGVLPCPTYPTNMLFWETQKMVSSVSNLTLFDQGIMVFH